MNRSHRPLARNPHAACLPAAFAAVHGEPGRRRLIDDVHKAVEPGDPVPGLERRFVRSAHDFSRETVDVFPCVSFGDIGAVTALAAVCLYEQSVARGYARGDGHVIVCAGEDGSVATIGLRSGN